MDAAQRKFVMTQNVICVHKKSKQRFLELKITGATMIEKQFFYFPRAMIKIEHPLNISEEFNKSQVKSNVTKDCLVRQVEMKVFD